MSLSLAPKPVASVLRNNGCDLKSNAEHSVCRTWKCISDPRSVNPFPGSFVNYINTLRFTPLSNDKQTLADWNGELWPFRTRLAV